MAIGTPVKIASNTNDNPGVSTITFTTTANAVVGDLLFVIVGFGGTNSPTPTCTDNASTPNVYTLDRVDHMTTLGTPHSAILSTIVTTQLNSGGTITVSFSPTVNRPIGSAWHVTGIATSSYVDQNTGAHGTSAAPSSGNITTLQAAELLVGCFCFGAASTDAGLTVGSGWTLLEKANNTAKSYAGQYQIVSSTGTFASNGTITSDDWSASVVSYKGLLAATAAVSAPLATTQQQPDHPAASLFAAGVQGPTVRPPITSGVFSVQQQPDHPGALLRVGVQGPNVAPPIVGRVFTAQEPPATFVPVARPGVQGPNVASTVTIWALTSREEPYHPAPWLRGSYNFTASSIVTAEIRSAVTAQEQPPQAPSHLRPGVQGPNVRPPVTATAFTTQELPVQPGSTLSIGVVTAPPAVLPAVTRSALTRPQEPVQPGPLTWPGIIGAAAAQPLPAVSRLALTRPQDPWHPGSFSFATPPVPAVNAAGWVFIDQEDVLGHPGAFVRAPRPTLPPVVTPAMLSARFRYGTHQDTLTADGAGRVFVGWYKNLTTVVTLPPVGRTVTTIEQPWHPLPYLFGQFVPPTTAAPVIRVALTTQEQPAPVPAPLARLSIQGPNVAAPVTSRAQASQEQPWHPLPSTSSGVRPANVGPQGRAVTSQEQPDHPRPFLLAVIPKVTPNPPTTAVVTTTQEQPREAPAFSLPGVFTQPTLLTPERRHWSTVQVQPDHPAPMFRASVPGANVGTGISNARSLTAQEQPWHPWPYFFTRIITTNIAPQGNQIATRQEQPSHPLPFMGPGVQGPNVAAGIQALLTKAEQVLGHPLPFLWSNIVVLTPVPPTSFRLRTPQEQPGHPDSFTLAGRSFTPAPGPHSPVRRTWSTVLEQPRETPSMVCTGVAPIQTAQRLVNIPRLLGTEIPANLRGSIIPPGLRGEIDQ